VKEMVNPKEWLEFGQKFHGHKCPAMPMGLRVGAAAMNKLGVERAKDGQLVAFIEIGDGHCATCFADGIQVITGATLGKGTAIKTHLGKWGVTLVDKTTNRAIRVAPKGSMMAKSKATPFFKEYRQRGIPASHVPNEIVDPLVENVMNAKEVEALIIGEVFHYEYHEEPHTFDSAICERCGEMHVVKYGAKINGKQHCHSCATELIPNVR